jgi:hypothetical protein
MIDLAATPVSRRKSLLQNGLHSELGGSWDGRQAVEGVTTKVYID